MRNSDLFTYYLNTVNKSDTDIKTGNNEVKDACQKPNLIQLASKSVVTNDIMNENDIDVQLASLSGKKDLDLTRRKSQPFEMFVMEMMHRRQSQEFQPVAMQKDTLKPLAVFDIHELASTPNTDEAITPLVTQMSLTEDQAPVLKRKDIITTSTDAEDNDDKLKTAENTVSRTKVVSDKELVEQLKKTTALLQKQLDDINEILVHAN